MTYTCWRVVCRMQNGNASLTYVSIPEVPVNALFRPVAQRGRNEARTCLRVATDNWRNHSSRKYEPRQHQSPHFNHCQVKAEPIYGAKLPSIAAAVQLLAGSQQSVNTVNGPAKYQQGAAAPLKA